MLKPDRHQIHQMSRSDTVFTRGRALQENKRLLRFHWSENGSSLEAEIMDQALEQARIRLDHNGMPKERACTCADSKGPGLCRHQVALLLEARERQRSRDAYPPGTRPSNGPLQLSMLVVFPPNPEAPFRVELKTGSHTLRPVADPEQFLTEWHITSSKTGGQRRTIRPSFERERYETGAQHLLDHLCDVYRRTRSDITCKKTKASVGLDLPSGELADLLPIAARSGSAGWTDVSRRITHPIESVRTDLPIQLRLDTQLLLHLEAEAPLIWLNCELTALRMEHRLFVFDKETMTLLFPYLDRMRRGRTTLLQLPLSDATSFVLIHTPEIRRYCAVELSEAAAALASPHPLESHVVLSWEGESLTAGIHFRYGTRETDPLADPEAYRANPMRDRRGENRLLGAFRQNGFLPVGNLLALHEDAALYQFLSDTLPQLKKWAVVEANEETQARLKVVPAPLQLHMEPGASPDKLSGLLRWDETSESQMLSATELPRLLSTIRSGSRFFRSRNGRFYDLQSDGVSLLATLLADPAIHKRPAVESTVHKAASRRKAGSPLPEEADQGLWLDVPAFRLPVLAGAAKEVNSKRLFLSSVLQQSAALLMGKREHIDQNTANQSDSFPPALSEPLNTTLRDYQKIGWQWLSILARFGFGGILADDMGLGKSIQVIALLKTLPHLSSEMPRTAIIVAPSSLVLNWRAEFRKFAPEMSIGIMDGSRAERITFLEGLSELDVLITSYPLLRRDIGMLRQITFSACILDEAQHIKNPETSNARSVKQIKSQYRFAVTGTPMENTPSELWSVFDFLMPGCLHSHNRFTNQYTLPILKDGSIAAMKSLQRLVAPFILRRLKTDVLPELPDKIDMIAHCNMTKEQRRLYVSFLKSARQSVKETLRDSRSGQGRIKILALLTRLRQICCDPELASPGCNAGSGKMELLMEVLGDALDAGHRILLFSQFTSMLDRIETVLSARQISLIRLDGRTPVDTRLSLVEQFNSGTGRVFLISLRAGGTGLNLTGADTVIHFDPWWNPSVEDQATDRAHRMGQKKTVQVIRLVTRDSIEEKIQQLQERKRHVVGQLIQPGGTFLDALSPEEIHGLFED